MIKRGDIYYVEKSPSQMAVGAETYAARPAVIVSDERFINQTGVVCLVYLTTSPKADLLTHVKMNVSGQKSIALCEQVNTVSINRLGNKYGEASEQEMTAIEHGIMRYLLLKEDSGNLDDMVHEETEHLIAENKRMEKDIETLKRDVTFYKGMFEAMKERYL